MKVGPHLIGFALLTLLYIGALVFIDRENHVFEHGVSLTQTLPLVALFALASFLLRYVRCRWLLARRNCRVPWVVGLLSYLSGFALTASPGRVGELLRIRYFGMLGVPADQMIACFVFERMCDLLVVLLLSAGLGSFVPGAALAFAFVVLVIAAVIVLSRSTALWMALAGRLRKAERHNLASMLLALANGLAGAVSFFAPREFTTAMVLGLAAWTIQSLGCVYLLSKLGIAIPPLAGFSIYPLALLIGAASMLPGGIGTTEAVIVLFLHSFGAPLGGAALAAVGMRISTLWFATALGFMAVATLEIAGTKRET
jgi:uncharacterized protein (TIRG00374 family)